MPQTIARVYAGTDAANAAVAELREHGFRAETIHASPQSRERVAELENASGPDEMVAPPEPQIDAIGKAGISRERAKAYAERLHHGEVLVLVVDPAFGWALVATEILEKHGPVAIDMPVVETRPNHGAHRWDWHSPTPLSSWLGWRVLSDDPTPLSNAVNWSVLKTDPASSQTLDSIRRQSNNPTPLSSKLGIAVLSSHPAPLSAKLGWRVLSEKAAPLSEKTGWRTLSDNPAPLSSKLGWRVLSDNPTPLSSALGWKVLSRD